MGQPRTQALYEAVFGLNLVPRACDPWEGNESSGIIRCRKPGILAKIELRIHFNGQSGSSLKRIIPEPSFPSQGSQARGTRLSLGYVSRLILVPRPKLGRPSQWPCVRQPRTQGLPYAAAFNSRLALGTRLWVRLLRTILVPRASRPHASSLGPGTHRTGTARKLALISNAHGN